MSAKSVKRWLYFIPLVGILWLTAAASTHNQDDQDSTGITDDSTGRQAGETNNGYKIRVGVDEVRLDAVVVDGRGRQITDLTADDFEIYQDKKQQEIIQCRYIAHNTFVPGRRALSSPGFGAIPPIPDAPLKRDDVQRTLTFLVHDFDMSFEEIYRIRMLLEKFVKEQMLPGDLVSIIKTTHGSASLQSFTSDRRELLSRIDSIQWSTYNDLPSIPTTVDELSKHRSQLTVLDYAINALQDMPGRKFIMLLTHNAAGPSSFNLRYNQMADAALRAGVVVHTMDIGGIQYRLPEYINRPPFEGRVISGEMNVMSATFDRLTDPEYLIYHSTMGSSPLPISSKTGGLFLDNNFFINGIGDLEEETKGYYLLSYIPPADTFTKTGKTAYHQIEIKVKRKGAKVRTRDGFYGEPAVPAEPFVTPTPLVEAMFSPFRYNDLGLTLASGYIDNLKKGYLLPTWMHLDGKDLHVLEEADGSCFVAFEVGASTTDIDGIFQEYGDIQIEFQVEKEEIRKLKKNGINFTVSIPVKKPGGYYVRVAVRDRLTESKGSAYQYIEIPNLKKNRLALSSIYIIDGEEDASWIRSIAVDEPSGSEDTSRKPVYRNPARKNFRQGETLEYMTVLYNAKTKKANPPELESQVILYRNGVGLYKSEVEAVDLGSLSDYKRIPIRQELQLEDSMQPGDYVLQLVVKDKKAKEKESIIAQTLDFKVTAP